MAAINECREESAQVGWKKLEKVPSAVAPVETFKGVVELTGELSKISLASMWRSVRYDTVDASTRDMTQWSWRLCLLIDCQLAVQK